MFITDLPYQRIFIKSRIVLEKEVCAMAVHHGGKVGKAAAKLASKTSSKKAKSNAGKALAIHKAKKH